MKKACSIFLAGMVLAQSSLTYAQVSQLPVSQVTPVTGLGGGGTFIGNAGKYDMNTITQDNTKIMGQIIEQIKDVQKIDRDYLLAVVERLNGHLQALANLKLQFTKLSQQSNTQSYVNIQDYLNLVNEINNRDQILRNEIQTQTLITRESLPSYGMAEAGGMKASVATVGNVEMKPVMVRVDGLRVQLINEMNNLQFSNIQTKLGQVVSIQKDALNPNLQGIRILTEEEMQAKTNLIQEKLTLASATQKQANRYVDVTVTLILNFLGNYGVDEWLRFRNDNDMAARNEAFEQIKDSFMRRSYLRRKYNVRLGAIQTMDYDKKIVNLEDFSYQPLWTALKSMRREAAATQPDVAKAFENARNWVELYDKKLTPVLASREAILKDSEKSREYSSHNTGVLVRANSAINTITGQDAAAEALLMIMRLVLSDARQEMMLYNNSNVELANYHDALYRSGEEAKKINNGKICAMDFTLSDEVVAKICGGKKAKMQNMTGGKSVQETFGALLLQLENVEKGRRQEAAFAQQMIDAAIRAGQIAGADGESGDSDMDLFK